MNLWGRFKFFGFGLLLGILMVVLIFGSRDWTSWTPEGRILTTIRQAEFKMSPKADCEINCLGINRDSLVGILIRADINFKESETQKKPFPIYKGEIDQLKIQYMIEVRERDSLVNLLSISKKNKACNC